MYTTELLLCEDLLREIFLKLPVKTLIRFKQVSKTWLYIITSHAFAKRHYYRSVANSQSPGNKNPKSFFLVRFVYGEGPDKFITSMSLTHDQQECTLHENIFSPYLENMYGWNLFTPPLVSVGLGLYILKFKTPAVALWNPATREIKVLPLPPAPFLKFGEHYYSFSFGQAEIKDDTFSYKVGFISSRRDDWPYFKLVLYDSSSNSWKVLSCDIGYDRSCYAGGINLKRKVHLISVLAELNAYIITFDYSSEAFGRMEVPALPQITGRYYDFKRSFLTLYDDKFLCLVVFWSTVQGAVVDTKFFDVWIMREYGVMESWGKEGTIGPVRDKIMLNYMKSTGGVFLKLRDKGSSIYLHSCASSSAPTKLPVIGKKRENMYVLENMQSLVSINGTLDKTRTQKLC